MKKQMFAMALGLGAVVLAAGLANAGSAPGSGIRGSVHDLSIRGVGAKVGLLPAINDPQERICIFCHAPHRTFAEAADLRYVPLWNKKVTTLTFDLYTNGAGGAGLTGDHAISALDPAVGDIRQPISVSKLCLSCHDGSVALNAYGSPTMVNDLGGSYMNGAKALDVQGYLIGNDVDGDGTGDLENHHPVGFDYYAVQAADTEIAAPSVRFAGSNVAISDVLYDRRMECATCHDVHNSHENMGEKLLWTSDRNSAFCCTCHLKCGTY